MARSRNLPTPYVFIAGLLALGVIVLFFLHLREARHSAARTVGMYFSLSGSGVRINEVIPGQPADVAGLRPGDVLTEVSGLAIESMEDYDAVAARFRPESPVVFRVLRTSGEARVRVSPGVAVSWLPLLITGSVMLSCLALGLAIMARRPRAGRARLLGGLLYLVALELAIPLDLVGHPALYLAAWTLFYLVTGAQISLELHLASSIPEKPPWLKRRPWGIALYYAGGLGMGLGVALTSLAEAAGVALPWTQQQAASVLDVVGLPLWALAVVVLLASQALRHPERNGRLQAAFVLLGTVPWAIYVAVTTLFYLVGKSVPYQVDALFPLIMFCYPVAIFVAIYRYHLFNIELIVRHGLLYTALTTGLLLVFYGALGAGGAIFSRLVGSQRHSVWVISASTLILGVLFSPMRNWLQRRIDHALFPERQALRQRLIHLASELPRQGTIQGMGHHLVERLSEIFAVHSAALLLTEPDSDLLLTVARRPRRHDERTTATVLISPHDPGIELLLATAEPHTLERLAEESPDLRERLEQLGAQLLVPLIYEQRLVGLVTLGKTKMETVFPVEQIDLLNLLAQHVAIALENVRLYESATYEGLTGLLRREAILGLLDRELLRARRYRRPLTVAFADLDHFKEVNDTYGHLAGDAVLKSVAEELAQGIRSIDAIGRFGGEEFLLIFPETDLEGALVVAEKIRREIEETVVTLGGGQSVSVTISLGLACLDEIEDDGSVSSQRLIAAADKALYEAKQAGRNRVEPVSGF